MLSAHTCHTFRVEIHFCVIFSKNRCHALSDRPVLGAVAKQPKELAYKILTSHFVSCYQPKSNLTNISFLMMIMFKFAFGHVYLRQPAAYRQQINNKNPTSHFFQIQKVLTFIGRRICDQNMAVFFFNKKRFLTGQAES